MSSTNKILMHPGKTKQNMEGGQSTMRDEENESP